MISGTAEKKRYYARVSGSRFIFTDGSEAHFNYGFFDTTSADEQRELNAVLGKNPNIYTADVMVVESAPSVQQTAMSESEIAAQDAKLAALAGASGRTTGDVNIDPNLGFAIPPVAPAPPGIFQGHQQGTMDPELQQALAARAGASGITHPGVTPTPTIAPPPQESVSVGITGDNPVSSDLVAQPEQVIGPGAPAPGSVGDPMAALRKQQAERLIGNRGNVDNSANLLNRGKYPS